MKLKVLIDNNTYIDEYVLGEPALAFYIEHNNKNILFDTGYSTAFIENAKSYGIDFNKLDYIVLSHAHNDHTRGLNFLMDEFDLSNTTLIINPDILSKRENEGLDIGLINGIEEIQNKMKVEFVEDSFELIEDLWLITNIKEYNTFENQVPIGKKLIDGEWVNDYINEECALAFQQDQKINLITGCSHRGICNLIEQSKNDLKLNTINSIIGGFHLFEINEVLDKTIDHFKLNKTKHLYPCHCVSFKAKSHLNNFFDVHEVGVGLSLNYDELR